jgi:hypothetical protein
VRLRRVRRVPIGLPILFPKTDRYPIACPSNLALIWLG